MEEADRLIRWILEHPGTWNSIVNNSDMNNSIQFAELLQILKENEFYQVIIILLSLDEEDQERQLCAEEIGQIRREMIAQILEKETIIQITDRIINKIIGKSVEKTEVN